MASAERIPDFLAFTDLPLREVGPVWTAAAPATAPITILYVGARTGTSLQRADALRELGHEVVHVASGLPPERGSLRRVLFFQVFRVLHHLKRFPDVCFANSRLLRRARRGGIDLVWIDKGLAIRPRTLRRLRALLPDARIVSYSPDDMFNPANQSARYLAGIPLYDLHVTTKSYNVEPFEELGARDVLFVDNAFDPAVHRPLELSSAERAHFAADVGFVGDFESERAELMLKLAEHGIRVTIRGPHWSRFTGSHPNLSIHDEYLDRADYARAVNATRINLGFLRKANRDRQTTRSVEIPACGGFLLAERTDEHRRLFREGVEADFFDGFDELLERCRRYLVDDAARARVARAGHHRCLDSGYSNPARLASALAHVARAPRFAAPLRELPRVEQVAVGASQL